MHLEQRIGARDKSLEHESTSVVVHVPTGDAVLDKVTEVVLPSGTVTFLFTDIEGSTVLWDRFPRLMAESLARHDALVTSAIGAHRGFVFSPGGDGFGAAFGSASAAAGAAVDVQRALNAERWPGEVVIRVRMGLHTGTAEERDGNYFGTAVNRGRRNCRCGKRRAGRPVCRRGDVGGGRQ